MYKSGKIVLDGLEFLVEAQVFVAERGSARCLVKQSELQHKIKVFHRYEEIPNRICRFIPNPHSYQIVFQLGDLATVI